MKTKNNTGSLLVSFCVILILLFTFSFFLNIEESKATDILELGDYCGDNRAGCSTTSGHVCDVQSQGIFSSDKGTQTCVKAKSPGLTCIPNDICGGTTKCDKTSGLCTTGNEKEFSSCNTPGSTTECASGLICSDYKTCVNKDFKEKPETGDECDDDSECRYGGIDNLYCRDKKCTTTKEAGTGEVGTYCFQKPDICAAGLECRRLDSSRKYECVKPGGEGVECKAQTDYNIPGTKLDNSLCTNGFICGSEGKCIKASGISDKCTGDADCNKDPKNPTLICDANKNCRVKENATCSDSNQCPTTKDRSGNLVSNYCDPTTKTCQAVTEGEGTLGYYCKAGNKTCDKGLECINNKCLYPKKTGDKCTADADCPSTDICDPSTKKCIVKPAADKTAAAQRLSVQCSIDPGKKGAFTEPLTNECINCGRCTICDIMNVITYFGKFLLGAAGLFAVVMLVYGGYLYMIGGAGKKDQLSKGKAAITSAIIGTIIVFSGWLIVNSIMAAVNAENKGKWYSPQYSCPTDVWNTNFTFTNPKK